MGAVVRGDLGSSAKIHDHASTGIARVEADRVILDGTTIDEVEKYHRDTLRIVLEHVNENISRREEERKRQSAAQDKELRAHKDHVQHVGKRLKFD
jgi:hypothetical protein